MNPFIRWPVVALVTAVAGCATLRPVPPPELDAGARLEAGLAALDEARFRAAFDELAWVMVRCPDHQAGLQARLALASLELDPRNPDGRPGIGAALLAPAITGSRTEPWLMRVVETAYLLALALGAPPADSVEPAGRPATAAEGAVPDGEPAARPAPPTPTPVAPLPTTTPAPATPAPDPDRPLPVHGCGPALAEAAEPGRPLPTLPGPSLMDMLAGIESERDSMAARVAALRSRLDAALAELEATRAELERVRRTLRP